MKRVMVEDNPAMLNLDPGAFAVELAYDQREVEEELQLVEAIRRHMSRILGSLESGHFQRIGNHSADGTLTLKDLLQRITGHIPHHIKFIEEKRAAMAE